jgi:2-methylisocitrate lyase-like PEP mutase family enzyme
MPELAARLRALHVPGDPLLLLNAWDAASARVVAAAGLPAVATTSSGLARALGRDDGQDAPVDEVLAAVRRVVAAVPGVPVTADLEAGYGLEPAELAGRLLATGAVGCNLEDTDHAAGGRTLRGPAQQAAYLAGVRAAAPDLVLNARVDVHLRAVGEPAARLDAALDRARRYADAGADCVYPITLGDEAALEAFVARAGVPVNALWTRDAPPPARLAELGVARVSVGGGLFAAVQQQAEALVARLRAGDPTALVDD